MKENDKICPAEIALYQLLTGRELILTADEKYYGLGLDCDGNFGSCASPETPNIRKSPVNDVDLKDTDGISILATYYESASKLSWEINTWKVDFSPILSLKDSVEHYKNRGELI
jgi:hypothetical protein